MKIIIYKNYAIVYDKNGSELLKIVNKNKNVANFFHDHREEFKDILLINRDF